MNSKITYHQQVSYCGKPRCRKCREGIGHGPYWYAYQTVNGRTIRTYIGKQLPAELQEQGADEEVRESIASGSANIIARLYVLGQFRLEYRNGQHWQSVTDAVLQHQRVRSLLSCLISSPGRKLGREQATDMLWPDLDFETATHRLDKAVYSLRQLLEPGRSRPASSSLLLTEHSTLILTDQSRLWVDADAFDALLAQSRTTEDPGEKEQLLEEAMALYVGEFLPEERNIERAQLRREALQRGWIGLLLELADLRIAREALPSAIDTLDRLLAVDPTNEAAVQRLMILLAQAGRRGEAIRAYQRFAAVLKAEYNIAPLLETRNLYESVQRGKNLVAQSHAQASLADTQSSSTSPPVAQGGTRDQNLPINVQDERETRPYRQVGRSNQSPLVGRNSELEVLHHILRATEQATRIKLAGQKKATPLIPIPLEAQQYPQCIMFMGDVGIGKTRLAEELAREAKQRRWAVAWSRTYAQESSIAYRLWIEALRKAMAQGLWQRQEITRHPQIYSALSTLLPELHELLPQEAPSSVAPTEQEQLRLWEATRFLLTIISESTPLCIILDDLQWADSSSCELLGHLVRQLRGHPILIVGTCRDTELPSNSPLRPLLTDLQREKMVETITIKPLTNEQIGTLVSDLPEPLVQQIQSLVAGNPFFAEELARSIKAQLLTTNATPTMPDTISAVLDLRMSRLSNPCQRLLTRAAILGGSFEFDSICLMEGSSTDEDAVLDLLEEALQAGMLTEEGATTHITYHFWHPLLVNHLYESLSAARRASLHRRAAEALHQMYSGREEEGAAVIAYHLTQGGGEAGQIVHYAEIAGDRAYALSAYPEAEKHYRLAVEQIGTLHQDVGIDERLHLAYLLERLAECARSQGNDGEARHFYECVLEERSHKRSFASSIEAQQEAQIRSLLWVKIAQTWYDTGDSIQAKQCCQLGEEILHEAGVKEGPAWASLRYQQSSIYWQEGVYDEALRKANEALVLFEDTLQQNHSSKNLSRLTRTHRTFDGDPIDLGLSHTLLAAITVTNGRSADALVHLNTALAIFEQHDYQRGIAWVCCNLGDAYLRRAERNLAQAAFQRSLSIAEQIGDLSLMSVIFGNMGILSTRFANLAEAEVLYNRGLTLAEQVNDPVYISLWYSYLALALQDQGKFNDAALSLRRALTISRNMKITPCIGFALITLGQLRISQALVGERNNSLKQRLVTDKQHLLYRAKASLQYALTLEGLEAETRIEGQLALAYVLLLLKDLEIAYQQAMDALEKARSYEQLWLIARSQRLLGTILTAQEQQELATVYFEQAIQFFHKTDMQLEWARALQDYGTALVQWASIEDAKYHQGLSYLQQAQQMFQKCNAALDFQKVEHILSKRQHHATKPVRKGIKEEP